MSFITAALIGAGGAIIGGAISSKASGRAADAQVEASNAAAEAQLTGIRESNALQGDMFNKNIALQERVYNEGVQRQQPFYDAGITSQNKLMDLLGLSNRQGAEGYGSLNRNFGMSDFEADPGYGFRMSEGLKALDRQAAARGGLISGGALKAAERYGQNLASDEYQNAFNRYQTNRANRLNPLQSMLGQGQSSANTLGNMGTNYANSVNSAGSNYANSVGSNLMNGANAGANGLMNAGAARASGYMGQANALTGALSGIGNSYMDYAALSKRYGGGGGGGSWETPPWIPDINP